MKTHLGNPLPRTRTLKPLLALVLAGALLGLTQCKMVGDPVTGVDVRENATFDHKRSKCEHQCNSDYKECRRDESRRHERAMRECRELRKDKKDDSKEYEACKDAERDLHKQNVAACKEAKKACKRDCRYNEGSGSGGR